jgi:LacI family transcriptional regulator
MAAGRDERSAVRTATGQLLAAGYRRIAFLDAPAGAPERLAGFLDAHREHGLGVEEHLVVLGPASADAAEVAVRTMLAAADPPRAVLARSGPAATGARRAVRDAVPLVELIGGLRAARATRHPPRPIACVSRSAARP